MITAADVAWEMTRPTREQAAHTTSFRVGTVTAYGSGVASVRFGDVTDGYTVDGVACFVAGGVAVGDVVLLLVQGGDLVIAGTRQIDSSTGVVSAEGSVYEVGLLDSLIAVTLEGGEVTLPAATEATGRSYVVKAVGVHATVASADTIDGETSISLSPWDALTVISTGSVWVIV